MSQTIIALDLGSYSVKMLELSRDFRNLTLIHAQEARIPLDPKVSREEAQALVIQEQFDPASWSNKIVITGFPANMASLRLLNIPATDRKTLDKIVPFEVENQMLMDLDDVHLDWEVLPMPAPNGEIQLFAAVVVRERFQAFMDLFTRLSIDPRDVTLDALALGFLETDTEDKTCRALVDCGHSKTNICIVQSGQPLFARSIGIAGREFTRTLEDDYKLPFLEAETLKQTDGMMAVRQGPGLSGDQEKISKSLRRAVDELAAELRQTLSSAETSLGISVAEVSLFGGSSRLKNLAPYLGAAINLPVRRVDYLQALGFQDYNENQSCSLQAALALGLRGVRGKSNQRINFRKGEFRPLQSLQSVQSAMGKAMTIALIILLFVLLNFVGKTLVLSAKTRKLEAQIQAEVARVIPNYKFKSVPHAVSVLQDKVTGNAPDSGPYAKIAQGQSPLVSMQRLSEAIPPEFKVSLSDISIDMTSIRIEGTAPSREVVERVREKLQQSDFFSKVSEDKVSKVGENYSFNFSMTIKTGGSES